MEQLNSTTFTPAGSTKSFKTSRTQVENALGTFEKTARTTVDKRRHCVTQSSNRDHHVLRNASHSNKDEFAPGHLKAYDDELTSSTQNSHLRGDSSYFRGLRFIDSTTQTEPPKPCERLEQIKEWWYSENPPQETESENSEEAVRIPVPPRWDDRAAKIDVRSFTCHCRSNPHRSINDPRPRPPWHIRMDRDDRRVDTKEPEESITLEDIVNWKEVERIKQRRNLRDAEVPNRSPAYDVPGYRWGVPLCIYDYCPQGYIDPEGDLPPKSCRRAEHREVINRNPAYDRRGFRWGVPLCVHDYSKQCPRVYSPGSDDQGK